MCIIIFNQLPYRAHASDWTVKVSYNILHKCKGNNIILIEIPQKY